MHRGIRALLPSKFAFAALALAMSLIPGFSGAARAQVVVNIEVYNFDFGIAATGTHVNPTIHVGDTVHWVWINGRHSTTSAASQTESWDSGDHTPEFSFDHTFTHAGTFNYFCDLHGANPNGSTVTGMSGSIVVQPVPEPASMALAACGLSGLVVVIRRRRGIPSKA